jgi:hypothetical protein
VWELELDLSRDQLPGRLLAEAAGAFPNLIGVRISNAYIGAGAGAGAGAQAYGGSEGLRGGDTRIAPGVRGCRGDDTRRSQQQSGVFFV